MNKLIIKHSILAGITVFTMALALPVVVSAQNARAEEAQTTAETKMETAQATAADKKEAAQTKLADAKLKACQNREKAVTNIMSRIGDRGQKQLDLFGTIAERTEKFYADKGKTLSNYDELVAEVAAKKTDAQTAVDATKATVTEFKCDGTDPKGAVSSFKESLKSQTEALKAYKTAVKNLIVGVKSVQGTISSTGGDQ